MCGDHSRWRRRSRRARHWRSCRCSPAAAASRPITRRTMRATPRPSHPLITVCASSALRPLHVPRGRRLPATGSERSACPWTSQFRECRNRCARAQARAARYGRQAQRVSDGVQVRTVSRVGWFPREPFRAGNRSGIPRACRPHPVRPGWSHPSQRPAPHACRDGSSGSGPAAAGQAGVSAPAPTCSRSAQVTSPVSAQFTRSGCDGTTRTARPYSPTSSTSKTPR
jgi:hypothetical protein